MTHPSDEPLIHICEVCGARKVMTPEEAYKEGWDYPPSMFDFGVLSARTCGQCGIDKTLWWRLVTDKEGKYVLTEADLALIERINAEPESIRPGKEESPSE